MKKNWVINLNILILLGISSLIFSASPVRIKSIDFGKYDENAFSIYEITNIIPKKNKLVSAVSVQIVGKTRISYKFVLRMPKRVKYLLVYDIGEWKRLVQGDEHFTANTSLTAIHILDENVYTIEGRYQSGINGGFVRGIFKGETLPIGKYTVDVYINNLHLKKMHFKIVPPYSKELKNSD
ncbi:MAG: hypothetical protein OEV44_04125 [Spirochaetota bacterium]|nr:hypothetical protein [Spirochaetota bacterium]